MFPLIHYATTSSDHTTTFYPIQKLQTPVTPPYFYTFLKLAFISRSAAVLWFNMVSAAVLGDGHQNISPSSVLAFRILTL